ncbi:MAG: LptF/LptG family permease [Gemmatimonadetes bacterium]|nr:LptF/LptG family permease [Gemmatimonadota bacterium]
MILNFISRQFGELVGKGLPASVIGEFFLLSIPFTIALTLPMSVLVAVLYAYSRLAAENEVTALKASGVSPWRIVTPSLAAGTVMTLFLLAFNDQVLPRANHQLKTLQDDISQTKPTFLLKPQIINAIQEGRFYLKAGKIDQATSKMREVVIYDLSDPVRRRTIYADSGSIALAGRDLEMQLYDGQMQQVTTERSGQLNRLFYRRDRITIRDVAKDFEKSKSTMENRGDRELGICAMQKRLRIANANYLDAKQDYEDAIRLAKQPPSATPKPASVHRTARARPEPHNIAYLYCQVLSRLIGVKKAEAADVSSAVLHRAAQDTVPKRAAQDTAPKRAAEDTAPKRAAQDTAARRDTTKGTVILGTSRPPAPGTPGARPVPVPVQTQQRPGAVPGMPPGTLLPPATGTFKDPFLARSAAESLRAIGQRQQSAAEIIADNTARVAENKLRFDTSRRAKNRYEIEIHKKFALAAACLIFVVLGAPLALRFPRGGVGLVLLVSLVVFALYYVGLIGGESLANKGIVPPFWAMWGTNVVLTVVGVVLLFRMGREDSSGRGGNWGDRIDALRDWVKARRGRRPVLTEEAA